MERRQSCSIQEETMQGNRAFQSIPTYICRYGVQWLASLPSKQRVRVQIPLPAPMTFMATRF